MKVEQIYTGCLAQGAYYIQSAGEAIIIDPLRETQPYIEKAKADKVKIKYILETHFHADFVSGHVDLASKTGATIVYGPNATADYQLHVAKDSEILKVGNVQIEVLHTPGHTMESTCYLLYNEAGKPEALFSGDTLFIGDVGRPDLAVKTDLSREDLAAHLYDSLRNKIMPLPDNIIVYPGHGAGSACGKNMSKETFDSLGNQKKVNYALRPDMSKKEFIDEVLDGILPPPQYFMKNAMLNKSGYQNFEDVLEKGLKNLNPNDFEMLANQEEALIIDTRSQADFVKGFIPNSIFIGLGGTFAPWVGTLVPDLKQPILLVTDAGKEEEAITRLARVGYDNTLGVLSGGFKAWEEAKKEVDSIQSISASDLASIHKKDATIQVLDVRKPGEFAAEHIENATNAPLDFINDEMQNITKEQPYYVHCAGGYRSVIFASILKARGFDQLIDVAGGYKAIAATDLPKTDYVCPSTLS